MRLLSVFTIVLLLSGCYQNESSITDSLVYCSKSAPKSLNPQINHDIATLDATTHQLYNRLVKIDPLSKEFVADLATHWQQSEDKLSYTFFLREDVNFQQTDYFTPSRAFNADDVLFSFQRMLDKKHPYHSVNHVTDSYFSNHPFTNLLADIVKVNDHTVKFILKNPDVTLLANLAAHYSIILSEQYAQKLSSEEHPEKIDIYPIGTGPYKFKNANTTGIIRYIAHSKYWGKAPAVKNLIFDSTSNNTKRYSKLLSGECDIMTHPAPSQLNAMSLNANVLLNSKPTANIALWSFNSVQKPFDQKKIRQAFSYAIDQKTIINAVFFQSATATNSLLVKQSWAYNPRSIALQYNPQLALNMLKENNYNFKKTVSILIPVDNSVFNPNFRKTAELIQANLYEIGINSEIISLSHTKLAKRLASGDYDTYLTGMNTHINDPDSLLRPLLSCDATILEGNSSQWCDSTVQELLDSTVLEPNFSKRIENYYQLQTILQQERPYYPIAHVLRIDVFNKNISGLLVNPLTGIDFQNVRKTEAQ